MVPGNILALIPARGGSKSVPRKNLLPLNGHPMVSWAIKTARASRYISRVIVTTDDDEISDVADSYGAEIPFRRPALISGDYSTDFEYHQHALQWLITHQNYSPDMIVNLRPTPPFRDPLVVDKAIEMFAQAPQADSLRSVQVSDQTPYKMWHIKDDGYLEQLVSSHTLHEPYNSPRQLLPLVYWQNGYVDICRPSTIHDKHSTTGDTILPFLIEQPSQDIDYPDQIKAAELQFFSDLSSKPDSNDTIQDIRHPS